MKVSDLLLIGDKVILNTQGSKSLPEWKHLVGEVTGYARSFDGAVIKFKKLKTKQSIHYQLLKRVK